MAYKREKRILVYLIQLNEKSGNGNAVMELKRKQLINKRLLDATPA